MPGKGGQRLLLGTVVYTCSLPLQAAPSGLALLVSLVSFSVVVPAEVGPIKLENRVEFLLLLLVHFFSRQAIVVDGLLQRILA